MYWIIFDVAQILMIACAVVAMRRRCIDADERIGQLEELVEYVSKKVRK